MRQICHNHKLTKLLKHANCLTNKKKTGPTNMSCIGKTLPTRVSTSNNPSPAAMSSIIDLEIIKSEGAVTTKIGDLCRSHCLSSVPSERGFLCETQWSDAMSAGECSSSHLSKYLMAARP